MALDNLRLAACSGSAGRDSRVRVAVIVGDFWPFLHTPSMARPHAQADGSTPGHVQVHRQARAQAQAQAQECTVRLRATSAAVPSNWLGTTRESRNHSPPLSSSSSPPPPSSAASPPPSMSAGPCPALLTPPVADPHLKGGPEVRGAGSAVSPVATAATAADARGTQSLHGGIGPASGDPRSAIGTVISSSSSVTPCRSSSCCHSPDPPQHGLPPWPRAASKLPSRSAPPQARRAVDEPSRSPATFVPSASPTTALSPKRHTRCRASSISSSLSPVLLPALVALVLLLLFPAPPVAACPRRVVKSLAALSSQVKAETAELIAFLAHMPQHYSVVAGYLQAAVSVPNADFSWGANTTWLLPTNKAIQQAQKKEKTFGGATFTPCHFLRTRRAFSLPVCGEPMPLYFLDDTWTEVAAGSSSGDGIADWGAGLACTVQRYMPPNQFVLIGSVDDKKSRGKIVHPSLFEGTHFTAQGVDSVIFP